MKEKTVYFLIAVVVIAGIFILDGAKNPNRGGDASQTATSTVSNVKTVTFYCGESKSITATFYIGSDTKVDLKLSDGRKLAVPRAISASGARYANADESFVFWNKGDTAFITENGTTTFVDCLIR